MANQFEFVGTLKAIKDSDKFKGYDEKTYDSGWISRRLRFNMVCGTNRHMLSVDGGKFEDEHNVVYTFSKGGYDDEGNKIKGESIQIPFKDRLKPELVETVAEFRKFVVDTEEPKRRYKLQNAMEKIKEGKEITAEELEEMDVASEAEISTEYEKSKKKRHEFISEWDFAEWIKKILDSGKYNDRMFLVKGNIENQFNKEKMTFYTSYVPTRIYLAEKDAEPKSEATMTVVYDENGLDTLSADDENGRYYLNAYTMEYNRDDKTKPLPCPITLALPKAADDDIKGQKIEAKYLKYFKPESGTVAEIGLRITILDGAEQKEITPECLSEEQQENLELGLVTMDDIRKELGVSTMFGDRITEYRIIGLSTGYSSGYKDTAYDSENLVLENAVGTTADTSEIDGILEGMDDDDI